MARVAELYQQRYWNELQLEAAEELGNQAQARGLTLASVAVAWVLAQPGVTSAIIGASRPEQLEATLAGAAARTRRGASSRLRRGLVAPAPETGRGRLPLRRRSTEDPVEGDVPANRPPRPGSHDPLPSFSSHRCGSNGARLPEHFSLWHS